MDKKNQQEPRMVVSCTTIPERVNEILLFFLCSIKNQIKKPDKIYLHIPSYCKRRNQYYDLTKIQPYLKDIYVNHIETDYGPITKLLPVLDLEKDPSTMIILVDDDCCYDPETTLLFYQFRHLKAIGFNSRNINFKNNKLSMFDYIRCKNKYPTKTNILEGSGGVMYERSIFPKSSKQFLDWMKTLPNEIEFVDDIVISCWCWKNNIQLWNIPCSEKDLWRHYGSSHNSLSESEGNLTWRNTFILNSLYEMGYFRNKSFQFMNNDNWKKKSLFHKNNIIILTLLIVIIIITSFTCILLFYKKN